jgi:hypothetical protein
MTGTHQVSTARSDLRWRADGREIFWREAEELKAAAIETAPTLVIGNPQTLFSFISEQRGWAVSGDGQRFVLFKALEGEERAEPDWAITVVTNWIEQFREDEDR